MVRIDSEFTPATVPEEEMYEGTQVDQNVISALPAGSRVLWVSTHGASFWAITTKVDVELADGKNQSYFLKVFKIENGKAMARAEFESTSTLHAIMPANISRPVASGTFAANPNKHFFLAEFRDMSDEMPPVPELVSVISEIHKKGASPTGKFGFHVTTFQGNQPLNNSWCDTWEEWFTREMRNIIMTERSLQGANQEMDQLSEMLLTKVIPRLLRPLQTGGRQLEPTLVHGDLWHGNIGIDMETDQPVLYDCCAIYAHNEYDLGMWRAARYRTNRPHQREYHKVGGISEPREDCDDRNALYALRIDLHTSCAWPANKRMRQLAIAEMRRLVMKYPDGFEGFSEGGTTCKC